MIEIYQEKMLIKTKFNIPNYGNRLEKRKRLLDKLNLYQDYQVIMVTAPAGYGKTALISSWAAEIKDQKVIWLMLEEEDNEEELFWSYFFFAFYRNTWIPKEMKERADAMLRNAAAFNKLFLVYFINDVVELETPMIMVLDDSGIIHNQRIHQKLQYLVRHLPGNLHLVLAGREEMELGLAKLKASGRVLSITGAEIAFTQEETITFFQNTAHVHLPQEEYIKLSIVLEGWITGMQMLALTIKDGGEYKLPVMARSPFLFNYLMEEVIKSLDNEVKNFLIKTAVLERFCPKLCDFLFNIDNSREIILKLESLNLFLICLERQDGWFRYHYLFREFLETLTAQEEGVLLLYQKAAKWYEKQECFQEAVGYAIKGQDFDKALDLITALSKEIACRGEAGILHKWNQQLPPELVNNNVRLLLNSAWAYSAEGNMPQAFDCIRKLKKIKTMPVSLGAEMTALSSSNLEISEGLDEMLTECKQVLQLLLPMEFLSQLICFNIGSILLLKGRVDECLFYFDQCFQRSMETGQIYLTIISKKAMVTSQIRNGQLQKAEQEILTLLKISANSGIEAIPAVGLLYAQLAEIYYQQNELTKALDMAAKGVRYGELGENVWTTAENYLVLEKIYQAIDDRKKYEKIKKKVLKCLEGRKFFDISVRIMCYHEKVLLAEGKLTSASRQIAKLEKMINKELAIIYPEFIFLKARYCFKKENLKKAAEEMLHLREAVTVNGQDGVLCEIQVFLAMVYDKMGNSVQALKELKAAVSLAEAQNSIQVFLNEGCRMEGMLKKLIQKEEAENRKMAFADTLSCCFRKPSENDQSPDGQLSKRELEILKLAAKGANNEEIAEMLFVSKNTVKTHLLHIYTKLGVHNRTMAVSEARTLNII